MPTRTFIDDTFIQTLINKTILAPSNTVAGVLDRDVVTADVVNTTVETAVYSFSVPGGMLGTIRALRLTLIGDYLNNSGANRTFTVRIKYGATTIHSVVHTIGAQAARSGIQLDVLLSANNATNAQVSRGTFWRNGTVGAAMQDGASAQLSVGVNNSIAEDSTLAKTLEITFQHDAANANVSGRALAVQVEVLR